MPKWLGCRYVHDRKSRRLYHIYNIALTYTQEHHSKVLASVKAELDAKEVQIQTKDSEIFRLKVINFIIHNL